MIELTDVALNMTPETCNLFAGIAIGGTTATTNLNYIFIMFCALQYLKPILYEAGEKTNILIKKTLFNIWKKKN